MENFYHVSGRRLSAGQRIKPYGRTENFRHMFDFCSSLVEKDPDKIPFVSVMEDFMKAKGVCLPNPYSLGSLLREVLAEQVRQACFPDKPSRLGSAFVFKDYADACRFRQDYRKETAVIYHCQAPANNIFTGDMAIITHARLSYSDSKTDFRTFRDSMKRYWAGDGPLQYPETICPDPVTIIGPVQEEPPDEDGGCATLVPSDK